MTSQFIRLSSVRIFTVLLFSLWQSEAIAADCAIPPVNKDNVVNMLDDLVIGKCLGDTECKTDLCNAVVKWEKKWDDEPLVPDMVQDAAQTMEGVRQLAFGLDNQYVGVEKFQTLTQQWIEAMSSGNMAGVTTKYFQPFGFRIQFDEDTIINLDVVTEEYCANSAEKCQEAFQVYTDIYTALFIQARVKKVLERQSWQAASDYIERLDLRWKAFLDKGRAMYPTDLLANAVYYKKSWSKAGFIEPPSKQVLFLHPDVAFQLNGTDNNNDDDHLEQALVLEVLGVYNWTWGGKKKAEITKPWGGALAVSWTGTDKVSFGLMAHMPRNWSLGLMSNDEGDLSFLVSADLGKLFLSGKAIRNDFKAKLLK